MKNKSYNDTKDILNSLYGVQAINRVNNENDEPEQIKYNTTLFKYVDNDYIRGRVCYKN